MSDSTDPTGGMERGEPPAADALGAGESDAVLDIASVVRLHHQLVYRYAYRLAGNAADAEDLAQQTFLIAQQKLPQVRDQAKVDRWLMAVVRSCFQKSWRRRRPIPAGNLELHMEDVPVTLPGEDPIDRERLSQALEELPEPSRVILLMFYFEDFSYKEIAEQLQIPLGTVMSRLARAKQRLRAQLTASRSAPYSSNGRELS